MLTELCVVQFQSVITLMIKQMHDYITIIYFMFFFLNSYIFITRVRNNHLIWFSVSKAPLGEIVKYHVCTYVCNTNKLKLYTIEQHTWRNHLNQIEGFF